MCVIGTPMLTAILGYFNNIEYTHGYIRFSEIIKERKKC